MRNLPYIVLEFYCKQHARSLPYFIIEATPAHEVVPQFHQIFDIGLIIRILI